MKNFNTMAGMGVGLGLLAMAGLATAQGAGGLFAPAPQGLDMRSSADPTVVRSRLVTIESRQIPLGADAAMLVGDKLQLNLFDDANYGFEVKRTEALSKTDYSLSGDIAGLNLGHCTLIVQGSGEEQMITGNCSSPEGFFQIRYVGNGVHVLREIDQSRFPPENPPVEVSGSGAPATEPDGPDPDPLQDGGVHPDDAQTDDDGSIVDMLVAYTPAARSASSNIIGEIQLAIAETNQAYLNSNVPHRVRLVGTTEVSYTETGYLCNHTPSDLDRLRGTTDGYMDNLHSLRNSLRADQVTLIVEGGDACGCAFMMSTVSNSFESSAFSVVARDCATGYYSFGHELGHNMGARHDCYVDSSLTPYAHNHGYVHLSSDASQRWRTIMAYNNLCQASGYNCTRIQYFSNPDISYLGAPTGTTGSGCTANNRLTHVNTDLTVSQFRDGYCYLSGMIERVLAYADSFSDNNYIYVRPSATASYYQYFRTTDDDLVSSATAAMRRKTDVDLRGNQSCFSGAYDFGGDVDYLHVNP